MDGAGMAQAAGSGERFALWRQELGAMTRLAAPIVLTQLAWVAIMTTDIAMIGRLGADALAGARSA